MSFDGLKYLVVGAGFYGAVIAERIAEDLGEKVLVIDRRKHIGGNCWSENHSQTGIEYHKFGTHIFHTRHEKVWNYIQRFTQFNGYRHQVLTIYRNKVYQMPINLETINAFYGVTLRPYEVKAFMDKEIAKEGILEPKNLEEKAVSLIGRPLYEALIRGYTIKQWQKDPKELPAFIIERLPVRFDYNESYYFDPWQGIPLDGYGKIFERMLTHDNIEVRLGIDFFDMQKSIPPDCQIIYTGPIDRFFGCKYGQLEWRTLDFEEEVVDVEDFQGTSVMNYADPEVPYTRIHEPRHLHIERPYRKDKTLIIKEYPRPGIAEEEPYYPVNVADNKKKLALYQEEAAKLPNVILGGRLAEYKYIDMDQTILNALTAYESRIKTRHLQNGKVVTK